MRHLGSGEVFKLEKVKEQERKTTIKHLQTPSIRARGENDTRFKVVTSVLKYF